MDAQKIIDAINDGVYLTDAEGIVTAANTSWCRHLNMIRERIVGRHITDVLRDHYFSAQCLQEGGPTWAMREREYEQSVTVRTLRDKTATSDFFEQGSVFSTATPIFAEDGSMEGILTLVRDLTRISDYDEVMEGTSVERSTSGMIGQSPEMERIRTLIAEVAPTNATILITGETGVGKEVVAGEIQRQSSRADQPYIKVNCSAIPENLVEAELFGYESGAFTGAVKGGKAGLLESANHGTVLLDEIGELPMSLQPKLLRAIQERVITRVGGVEPIPIDIRILTATNQNLSEMVARKQFREDLYYRLNVIPIHLPPLRARGADIALLAESFLNTFNSAYHRDKSFTRGALHVLEEYNWPGNIRELRNLVERLVVLGDEREISPQKIRRFLNSVGEADPGPEVQLTLKEATDRVQANLIEGALLRYGSTYKAAAALGTSQSTLMRRARQLGIPTAPR